MEYKTIDKDIIEKLLKIVDNERLISENINDDYSHDEMPIYGKFFPSVVVKPNSTIEISNIMKLANENHIPVTVRGAGTGLVGGALAVCGGVLIDMSLMNKVIEIDEENKIITVEPGIAVENVKALVNAKGLFYPPEPGEGMSSIGGNISTNAAGMNNIKYGATRDYVNKIEIVLANGDIVTLGNDLAKSSSGYELLDLVVGSEGTLGIITKATLRLINKTKYSKTCLAGFGDLSACIKSVPKIMNYESKVQSLEFFDLETVKDTQKVTGINAIPYQMGNTDCNYYLLIRLDGNDEDLINKQIDDIGNILMEDDVIDVMVADSKSTEESIWKVRSSFLDVLNEKVQNIDESDVVVPVKNIVPFVEYINSICSKYNLKTTSFGHAGDGNIHFYFYNDDIDVKIFKNNVSELMKELYDKAYELDGCISGEHGIGYGKLEYFTAKEDTNKLELMKRIKMAFDSNNILNPNKIFK